MADVFLIEQAAETMFRTEEGGQVYAGTEKQFDVARSVPPDPGVICHQAHAGTFEEMERIRNENIDSGSYDRTVPIGNSARRCRDE